MRLTRAALRAEAIHIDENETFDGTTIALPPTSCKARAPLGEVAGNTTQEAVEDMAMPKKGAAKGKGGRKAKGKKGKKAEENEEAQVEVLEDDRLAAGSPASDQAVEELRKEYNGDIVQVPMLDERPVSPPSRAIRMTRRQLAKAEELSKSQSQAAKPEKPVEIKTKKRELLEPQDKTIESKEPIVIEAKVKDAPEPQEQATLPEEITQPEQVIPEPTLESTTFEVTVVPDVIELKTLLSEKPTEEDSSLSRTASRSPARSPGKVPMRLEESIEAIDALEEAIEAVGKALPELDALESDEKSPRKKTHRTPKSQPTTTKPKPSTAAPKLSRNPNDPKSLKEPVTAKPRPASMIRPSLSRSASVRTASSSTSDAKAKAEVTDYLASRRRPISVSFPTPPPPPKSTKPPTKSTFQLPGEAVAARLKAAREERLKKEEEEAGAKKCDFKARPAPKSRAGTMSVAVKQTAASRARESMMQCGGSGAAAEEKENKTRVNVNMPGPTILPLKRTSSISTTAGGKRQSTLMATTKRNSGLLNRPASTLPFSNSSSANDDEKAPQANASIKRERPAFTTSTSTSNTLTASKRLSMTVVPQVTKSTITPADVATQRLKGREVFNRDRVEKEERERLRKEKEEAAKRARAEAAERGRIASREWAEKQKMRRMVGVKAGEEATMVGGD